jgi:hypothetical protein
MKIEKSFFEENLENSSEAYKVYNDIIREI